MHPPEFSTFLCVIATSPGHRSSSPTALRVTVNHNLAPDANQRMSRILRVDQLQILTRLTCFPPTNRERISVAASRRNHKSVNEEAKSDATA